MLLVRRPLAKPLSPEVLGAGGFFLPVSVFDPCCLFVWQTKLMTNPDVSIRLLEEGS